jgi:hypothetical protein
LLWITKFVDVWDTFIQKKHKPFYLRIRKSKNNFIQEFGEAEIIYPRTSKNINHLIKELEEA